MGKRWIGLYKGTAVGIVLRKKKWKNVVEIKWADGWMLWRSSRPKDNQLKSGQYSRRRRRLWRDSRKVARDVHVDRLYCCSINEAGILLLIQRKRSFTFDAAHLSHSMRTSILFTIFSHNPPRLLIPDGWRGNTRARLLHQIGEYKDWYKINKIYRGETKQTLVVYRTDGWVSR